MLILTHKAEQTWRKPHREKNSGGREVTAGLWSASQQGHPSFCKAPQHYQQLMAEPKSAHFQMISAAAVNRFLAATPSHCRTRAQLS